MTNGEMPAKQTTNSGQGAEQETSSDQAVTAQEKRAATTTETNVATNVHLSLVDTDKKETLPADNKGWTNQEYRLSLKGSFDVELKQLLDGQSVKIAQIETSSSNGQFMNFTPKDTWTLSYNDQPIGNLRLQYDEKTGQGSIALLSTLGRSPFSGLTPDTTIAISLDQMVKLVVLNWQTDPQKLTPSADGKPYWEQLSLLDGKGQVVTGARFELTQPNTKCEQTDALWEGITNSTDESTQGYFVDHLTPLAGNNTAQTIADLNHSFGQESSFKPADQIELFYKLQPLDGSIVDLNNVSIYINKDPNAVTSDGRLTDENLLLNDSPYDSGRLAQIKESALTELKDPNFEGVRYVKQADGSYLLAVHVPKRWLTLTDENMTDLVKKTSTGTSDPEGEKADLQAVKKFYGGSLNNLSTRFVVGMWLGYPSDAAHPANHFQLMRLSADGVQLSQNEIQQPGDKTKVENQTAIRVHVLSANDGRELSTQKHFGWPKNRTTHSEEVLTLSPKDLLPKGHEFVQLKDNKLVNGQSWANKDGWQELVVDPVKGCVVNYPETGTADYYVFAAPIDNNNHVVIPDKPGNKGDHDKGNSTDPMIPSQHNQQIRSKRRL